MIFEGLINLAFSLVEWLIGLLPSIPSVEGGASWISSLVSLVSAAGQFVPLDILTFALGNIVAWAGVHLIISLVRFVLDFIPLF